MNLTLPWIFALVTALCFALLAWRTKQGWLFWGLAGAIHGLVTSTIILGLGEAAHVSMSREGAHAFLVKEVFLTSVAILITGWVFTLALHRNHLLVWRAVRGLFTKKS
jgi:hypothetical protein